MALIWCYVLDTTDVTGVFDYSLPAAEESSPQLHKIYQCEDDNIAVGSGTGAKLYHAADGKIDATDLQRAIDDYVEPVVVLSAAEKKAAAAAKKKAAAKDNVSRGTKSTEYDTKDTKPKG